ncbi:MAG: hypothetical protein J6U66_11395 [Lachnospiraceae bacterium]|nr:hypothetical protein [Lachnospiraceae bacterium]
MNYLERKNAYGKGMRLWTACAAGLLLCAFVLLSTLFLSMEVDHECDHEDCPVCSVMLLCETSLHQMGDVALALSVIAVFFYASLRISCTRAEFVERCSLVGLGVRLNN